MLHFFDNAKVCSSLVAYTIAGLLKYAFVHMPHKEQEGRTDTHSYVLLNKHWQQIHITSCNQYSCTYCNNLVFNCTCISTLITSSNYISAYAILDLKSKDCHKHKIYNTTMKNTWKVRNSCAVF